jgi:hypothetical protein
MNMHTHAARQLADEKHRDLVAEARRQRSVRQLQDEPATAGARQPLTSRLWRRLRPVSRPRLEPQV